MIPDHFFSGLPAGLTPAEVQAQFDQLQQKLVPLWQRSLDRFNQSEQTIVVVPSMTVDLAVSGFVLQGYEERFLFLLLLLAQPRARMIYVTSQAIHPSVIEYYLNLLPGVIPSHARRRLTLLAPYDDSTRPLSLKLLERPRLLEQISDGHRGQGPRPSGLLQHHVPRAKPRPAPRHPALRRRPAPPRLRHQDRLPTALRAGRHLASAGGRQSGEHRGGHARAGADARAATRDAPGGGEAQRWRFRRGQRLGGLERPAARRGRGSHREARARDAF